MKIIPHNITIFIIKKTSTPPLVWLELPTQNETFVVAIGLRQSSGEGQRRKLWLLCVKLKKCGMCEEGQRCKMARERVEELNWGSFGALCGLVCHVSTFRFVHCAFGFRQWITASIEWDMYIYIFYKWLSW